MQPLILHKNDTPTIFNKDAAVGAAIGTYFGPVIGTSIGGLIGGVVGKNRIATEALQGKVVSEPSVFNKDTIIGGVIGNTVGVFAAGAILAGGIAATPLALPAAIMATGAFVGSTALGAYIGGRRGKAKATLEYAQAEAEQYQMANQAQPHAHSQHPAHSYGAEPAYDHGLHGAPGGPVDPGQHNAR